MPQRSYHRMCALSRALELVGDRWTLIVVGRLLGGSKRYTDLHDALPDLSPNLLADRLKRLEADGLVVKRVMPPPIATAVYELTEFGAAIEPAILELMRWGSVLLADPDRANEPIDPDWPLFPLRWLARRVPAVEEVGVAVVIADQPELRILVAGPTARLQWADQPVADMTISAESDENLGKVLSGQKSLTDAIADGDLVVVGDSSWFASALDSSYANIK